LYNPHLPDTQLTLALAHDLGHNLLGHIENSRNMNFKSPIKSLFATERMERDASVIAFLCLIPTHILIDMALRDRLQQEELYSDFRCTLESFNERIAMQVCAERIAIFNDLLSICGGKCLRGEKCNGCRIGREHNINKQQ
jgi:Zn-dependent peptidase ImmA (M78 family)